MNVYVLFLRLLGSVPLAHATAVSESLGQYQSWICNPNFAPAWMCGISGTGWATGLLGRVTGFVTGIAAGVGVCVFIYACIQMVMSQGQDDKMAAAKKMAMIALVGVFLTLSVGAIVGYLSSLFWKIAPHT